MTGEAHAADAGPGDRSVKPFELFFDLVFVYAFTQVTQLLAHELSWGGLGQGRGIFKKCVNSQAVYLLSERHGLEAQERR